MKTFSLSRKVHDNQPLRATCYPYAGNLHAFKQIKKAANLY